MISFRFHLVSLVAVFLALALGIAVGATVVDKATVAVLERQLHDVDQKADRTNLRNDVLQAEIHQWSDFSGATEQALIGGRLSGVPVLLVAVRGMDAVALGKLTDSLVTAGAHVEGTVWFTGKLNLDPKRPEDAQALAAVLGVANGPPDALRQAAVSKLAAAWGTTGSDNPLDAFRQAGFIDVDAPPTPRAVPGKVPLPETRFVVASDATPDVPNEQLAEPLTAALARAAGSRVLAVEPGSDPSPSDKGERAVFLGPLLADAQVGPLLSTVDDLEDFKGRVAAVYAIQDMSVGRLGHYGVGPRATRLIPDQRP